MMMIAGHALESGALIEVYGKDLEEALANWKVAEKQADAVHMQLTALLDADEAANEPVRADEVFGPLMMRKRESERPTLKVVR